MNLCLILKQEHPCFLCFLSMDTAYSPLKQNSCRINSVMEDESSVSTVESSFDFQTGTENELLRIKGAQLWLMVAGESILVHSGEFALRLIEQSCSPLSAVICMVGEHQWPLAKDSPVLRVGFNRFSFALHGWFYGLTVPKSEEEQKLKRLEEHLQLFSSYEDHSDHFNRATETESEFWSTTCLEIEKLSEKLLQKTVTRIRHLAIEISGEIDREIGKKTEKAIRMSAVAKLVGKTLLRGAIDFHFHVNLEHNNRHTRVFPSIFAFLDVVDAVETGGRSILGVGKDLPRSKMGASFWLWCFNQTGLKLLLRAVATSTMLYTTRKPRSTTREQDGLAGKCNFPASEAIGSSFGPGRDPCKGIKPKVNLKFSLGLESNE